MSSRSVSAKPPLRLMERSITRSGWRGRGSRWGNVYWSQGARARALGYYQRAYRQRRKTTNYAATAGALASVANIHVELGQLKEARDEYEQVLSLAHRAGDRRIIARTENNLSECLLLLGQPGTALNHARSALLACRKIGDRSEEPNVLINLGRILGKLKFSQEARNHLEAAAEVSRDVGDRRAQAVSLSLLAQLLRSLPTTDCGETANQTEDQAFALAQEIGAQGLLETICNQAIEATEAAGDSTRLRSYRQRRAALPLP